jgi:diguanylate cyclase (GGDEF)-like protein
MNRQAFDHLFKVYCQESAESGKPFSAVLLDIDRFKPINDRYGHLVGDKVIQRVAELVQKTVRSSDVVARWGGEEFIIFLKECTLEQAEHIAEKIRGVVEQHIFALETKNLPLRSV